MAAFQAWRINVKDEMFKWEWSEENVQVPFSNKYLSEIRNAMSWVKTFQIAEVSNTDKTSVNCVILKTSHCLIFAFCTTNSALDLDRAQPSWRPFPQDCPLLKLSNGSFALPQCMYKIIHVAANPQARVQESGDV